MRVTILPRLLAVLAVVALGWGTIGTDLHVQAQTDPKKDDKKDDKKTDPKKSEKKPDVHERLPLCRNWDLRELEKLGTIVETRNEMESKNRVVWILSVKKALKDPTYRARFLDDERGPLWIEKKIEFNALKEKDPETGKEINPPRVQVVLKLPPTKNLRDGVFQVVIEKIPH